MNKNTNECSDQSEHLCFLICAFTACTQKQFLTKQMLFHKLGNYITCTYTSTYQCNFHLLCVAIEGHSVFYKNIVVAQRNVTKIAYFGWEGRMYLQNVAFKAIFRTYTKLRHLPTAL